MISPRNILLIVVVSAAVIFTVQNYAVTQVSFLWFTFSASRSLVLLLTLALGIVIGWLTSGKLQVRFKK